MTEIDLHKLELKSLKVTIKWSTFFIIMSSMCTLGIGLFKAGVYMNKMQTYLRVEERKVSDLQNELQAVKINQYQFSITQSGHTIEIDNIKKRIPYFTNQNN